MIRKLTLVYRRKNRRSASLPIGALLLSLCCATLARAQSDQPGPERNTADKAGRIVSQPVRDIGITKDKIPPVLEEAVKEPYALPSGGSKRCPPIVAELGTLNDALGPDFDADRKKNEDRATQLAEAGGSAIVNSLIPLRGVVREVSGAASADRRKAIAINAGLARRGYLRGLAQTRGCKVPVMPDSAAKVEKTDEDNR